MYDECLYGACQPKNILSSILTRLVQIILFACITLGWLPSAKGKDFNHNHTTRYQLKEFYAQISTHSQESFEVDVTEDGYPEIFIGFVCGAESCEYLCFKNNVDGTYSYAGTLSLKIGSMEISDISHNGFKDIIMIRRCNAGKKVRLRYEVRDNEYVIVESIEVKAGNMHKVKATSLTKLNW